MSHESWRVSAIFCMWLDGCNGPGGYIVSKWLEVILVHYLVGTREAS